MARYESLYTAYTGPERRRPQAICRSRHFRRVVDVAEWPCAGAMVLVGSGWLIERLGVLFPDRHRLKALVQSGEILDEVEKATSSLE